MLLKFILRIVMLIPVQSFQKIIIGINQRNIDLLTMRYTTDAMHQNKVIVSPGTAR